MNPVVLIATHERLAVTKANIESLMMQSVQPKIVLGVSDEREADQYHKWFPEVEIYGATNNPLGFKWQMGVMGAKKLKPDPLIILGSDDFLGVDYIENALVYMKMPQIGFLGIKRWYVYAQRCLYLYDYLSAVPLGGGRCYSFELLEEINWQLFDPEKRVHLDDLGWENARKSSKRSVLVSEIKQEGLNIVSIKGDWPTINPYYKFQKSKNVRLLYQSRDIAELQYLANVSSNIL